MRAALEEQDSHRKAVKHTDRHTDGYCEHESHFITD